MTTGELIKRERKEAGLTQIEVAQKTGISVNSLRLYESDKRHPTIATLRRIAFALNITVSAIVSNSNDESNYIGERIRQERIKAGLTQKQLGDFCGMNDSAIRKYESGRQRPKIETLERIANALNVHISAFILDSNKPSQSNQSNLSKSQLQLIYQLSEIAINNYSNHRPIAFIPTKKQYEILKAIIDICNQNA